MNGTQRLVILFLVGYWIGSPIGLALGSDPTMQIGWGLVATFCGILIYLMAREPPMPNDDA